VERGELIRQLSRRRRATRLECLTSAQLAAERPTRLDDKGEPCDCPHACPDRDYQRVSEPRQCRRQICSAI